MNLTINALKNSLSNFAEELGLPKVHATYAVNRAGALVVGLVLSKTDVELLTLNTRPRPPGPDDEPVEAVPMIDVIKARLIEIAKARGLPHARTAHRAKPNGGLSIAVVLPEQRPGEWTRR